MTADVDFIHGPIKQRRRFEDQLGEDQLGFVHRRFIYMTFYQLPAVTSTHFKRLFAGFDHQIFVVAVIYPDIHARMTNPGGAGQFRLRI